MPEVTTTLVFVQVIPLAGDVSSNATAVEEVLAASQSTCPGLLAGAASAVLQLQLGAAAQPAGTGCSVTRSTAGSVYASQGASSLPLLPPLPPPTTAPSPQSMLQAGQQPPPPFARLDNAPPPLTNRQPQPRLPIYLVAVLAVGSSLVVLSLVALVVTVAVTVFRQHSTFRTAAAGMVGGTVVSQLQQRQVGPRVVHDVCTCKGLLALMCCGL